MGAAGAAIGGYFGGPQGAQTGFAVGVTLAGVLFPPKLGIQEKGKLDDVRVTGSGYGQIIPAIYGKGATGGNILWATELQEHSSKKKAGAKGGPKQVTKTYTYSVSLWVAFCEGEIGKFGRIWADDRVIYDNATGLTDEIQQISTDGATSGTFSVEFRGQTSAAIPFDAAAGLVQSTLEALTTIGPGNISVSGVAGGPWQVTFTGDLAGQNVPRMDMINPGLFGGGPNEGITTVQQGEQATDIEVFLGGESQEPWSVAEAVEGVGLVPAYRGIAGIGLETFDLSPYGNRIPMFKAEILPL